MPWKFHVRRKSGAMERGIEIRHTPIPASGTESEAALPSGRVRVRVGGPHVEGSKRGGTAVIEVQADEI